MGGRGRGGYRGGNKRGRTQRRDFKDGRPNVWKKQRPDSEAIPGSTSGSGWEPFVMECRAFEVYYKKQGVVPPEEWDTFVETLRKPLPTCFRINGSGQFAQDIRDQMQHDFFDCLKEGVEIDGEILEPIKPLDWYPDKLAWVLSVSRMQLRKLPILERIHEFLKQENEIGSITRQEAVSMLPPLFLKVEPHHRVLDMCAAPGSKTFQLLEMIHKTDTPGTLPEGLVIANDLDVQRCHLLIHQTKRMCSPNILVTNHEAQHFPGLREKGKDDLTPLESGSGGLEEGNGLLFDRILCDVPCSGDGTIRKAPDIWKKWHSGLGNGIHRLQVQIAMRGVALLRVGGRLVYSTCSLNPVEDEAVVGEIIRQGGGSVELLDVSSELPGLKCRPGLKTWKVRDKRKWLCSYSQVDRHRAGVVVPSMFPSGDGWDESAAVDSTVAKSEPDVGDGATSEDVQEEKDKEDEEEGVEVEGAEAEVSNLPLERCMRILPHDQNSGGFFIAVFRKVAPYKAQQKSKVWRNDKVLKDQSPGCGLSRRLGQQRRVGDALVDAADPPTEMVIVVDAKATNTPSMNGVEQLGPSLGNEISPMGTESLSSHAVAGEEMLVVGAPDSLAAGSTACEETLNPVAEVVNESVEEAVMNVTEGDENKGEAAKEWEMKEDDKRMQVQGGKWKGVDPVLFLKDEQVIESLVSYYGIKDTFSLRGHLVTRSEDISRLKRIYYVSQLVGDVLRLNFRVGEHLKITSAGLKIFERQAPKETVSHCAFRIASEGLPVLIPHMTKQIVYASTKDFKQLLDAKAVPFAAFHDLEFVSALQSLLPGCCVVVLPERNEAGELNLSSSTAVGCWRGRNNVSLLITKAEAGQMLQRLSLTEETSEVVEEPKEGPSELITHQVQLDSEKTMVEQ